MTDLSAEFGLVVDEIHKTWAIIVLFKDIVHKSVVQLTRILGRPVSTLEEVYFFESDDSKPNIIFSHHGIWSPIRSIGHLHLVTEECLPDSQDISDHLDHPLLKLLLPPPTSCCLFLLQHVKSPKITDLGTLYPKTDLDVFVNHPQKMHILNYQRLQASIQFGKQQKSIDAFRPTRE